MDRQRSRETVPPVKQGNSASLKEEVQKLGEGQTNTETRCMAAQYDGEEEDEEEGTGSRRGAKQTFAFRSGRRTSHQRKEGEARERKRWWRCLIE